MKNIFLRLKKGFTWKQMANYGRYRLSSTKQPFLKYEPIGLLFAVTERCTYQCKMCHVHSPVIEPERHFNVKKKDVSLDLFRDVIDRFSAALSVSMVGSGEPLLHKDIYEMIAFAHKRHMVTRTITNGFLLGTQIGDICRSPLDHVSISVNGYDSSDFFRMTGMDPEKFPVVLDNISKLIRERDKKGHPLKISISFILDKENYRNAGRMLEIARNLKVDECYLLNFIPTNTPGFTADERALFRSDEMEKYFSQLSTPGAVQCFLPHLIRKDRKTTGCHFPFTTLRIDSNGNIGACGGALLNLRGNGQYTEPGIWNGRYLTQMRKSKLSIKEKQPEPCYVCAQNY